MPRNEIDVVEDFVVDSCCDEYNKAYLLWRRSGPSKFVFRFTKHGGERVFMDGEGFIDITPAKVSAKVLGDVGWMLGVVLTFVLFCDTVGGGAVAWILRLLGVSVRYSVVTMELYGSYWGIALVKSLMYLLKFLLPAVYLIRRFHLPRTVYLPLKLGSAPDLLFGVSAAILSGLFVGRLSFFTRDQFFSNTLFRSELDFAAIIVYAFFEVIVVSLLVELFFSGVLFQTLRQFGDVFALLFVSGVAFLIPNELPLRIGTAVITFLSCYAMLRTGSMLTCFFIRIAYAIANFSQLLFLEAEFGELEGDHITLLILGVAVVGLLFSLLMHRLSARRSHTLNSVAVLTMSEKLDTLLGSTTMLPWFACSVLLAIVQIVT